MSTAASKTSVRIRRLRAALVAEPASEARRDRILGASFYARPGARCGSSSTAVISRSPLST
ncbi:MAG: hypothetical protein U0263_28155 [Polyangiaceae bacterium]